ncbi:MAG: matrixin family metalloprotease [Myxococcaceae bacterium]|nr:matrixin family metalloprotease [Myxococcaceae bacterium]
MRLVLVLLVTASASHAFELKKDRDGDVVRWNGPVRFVVDRDLDQKLKAPGALDAVKAAVKTWASAMPNVDVTVEAGDPSTAGSTIAVIDHDWPYDDGVMGVAILKVDYANDRIVEADLFFNAAQNEFRVLEPGSKRGGRFADVQNTVTHELGHALGLQHEQGQEDAVMYPLAYNGDVNKRNLSADDIAGLDALYPLTAASIGQDSTPLGCSASGASGPVALGLMLLAVTRRRAAQA